MGGALYIVWGIAGAAILALGALLIWTLRGEVSRRARLATSEASGSGSDTLLFYYEQESVRSTPNGEVIVRIPGMAWEPEWQDDLLRLEVARVDPSSLLVPGEWGAARVLAAYALRAYRMTDLGTDIQVERFAAPVDVFVTTAGFEPRLRFAVKQGERWTLAPPAALSPDTFEDVDIPAGQSWAAASIAGMRDICLVRMPAPEGSAEQRVGAAAE
jgi:hypothetical protein